jgi:polyisoprenoid-binding protein YceI
MKKTIFGMAVLVGIAMISFAFANPKAPAKKESSISKSKVEWKAYKVTGSHNGTIDIKSGKLIFNDDKLVGGAFVMNMNTLNTTDLSGEYKDKLDGHLKSDDFFGVAKHPTSSIAFTNVKSTGKNSYKIIGDITIKGIKKSVTFNASIYGNKANAALKLDRTDFDIKYGSNSFFDGLKDKAIYDEFDLVIDVEF